MKKKVIAIIAVAGIHFTVSQTILSQQITINLPKIGNPYTGIDYIREAIGEGRVSETNERRRIEGKSRTAGFYGNTLTEFGVQ